MFFEADIPEPDDRDAIAPRTCWYTKSPFQSGLLFVLMIAIPFFIVMIVVYALIFILSYDSEQCSRLCNTLLQWKAYRGDPKQSDYPDEPSTRKKRIKAPNCTDPEGCQTVDIDYFPQDDEEEEYKVVFAMENYTIDKRELTSWNQDESDDFVDNYSDSEGEFSSHNITENFDKSSLCSDEQSKFPSIAALLQDLYTDDEEKILKCTIVVLSPYWALTIDECVQNDTDSLFVRLNSDFWSKDGVLKKVEAIIKYQKLAAVRLVPEKGDHDCFNSVRILKTTNSTEAGIFFWKGNIEQPLNRKFKYEELKMVPVNVERTEGRLACRGEGQIGAPVLDQHGILIGFQSTDRKNLGKVLAYRSVDDHFEWLQEIRSL